MTRKRSMIAGFTDYTCVGIGDIIAHLRDWQTMAEETVTKLRKLQAKVEANRDIFESPTAATRYIDRFCDLFDRYASDFRRLVEEMPRGVRQSHIESISQIYESSRFEEQACIAFKQRFIEHDLKNEKARPVLDDIYSETRDTVIDYLDLSNLAVRLRALVTSSSQSEEILKLQPGAWGVSLDLKALGRRVRGCWSQKRSAK